MTETTVYTDGACLGNPGPGGWAWAVPNGQWRSGAAARSTNQRMEISAALDAARSLSGPLQIVSDSTYVVNCFRDRWWERWVERGWVNSARRPVANRDLWEPLVDLYRASPGRLRFRWVKGHSAILSTTWSTAWQWPPPRPNAVAKVMARRIRRPSARLTRPSVRPRLRGLARSSGPFAWPRLPGGARAGLVCGQGLAVPEGGPVLLQGGFVRDVLLGENAPGSLRVPDQGLVVLSGGPSLLCPAGHVGDEPASGRHVGKTLSQEPVQGDVTTAFHDVQFVAETGSGGRRDEHQLGVVVPFDVVPPNQRRQARVLENVHQRQFPARALLSPDEVALFGAGAVRVW